MIDAGYTEPTPIQAKAIPVVLEGRDIMGGAQTGTGKTAAFTLPLLHKLAPFANTSVSPARHPVRALVLCPTRELAAQVEESVRTYGKHLPLRSASVYGGVDINPQIKALHGGVEILVATPGRLLDHMHQRTVKLGQVQYLVLDEADRMLDMGFLPDIKRILAALPPVRQNLLFSATFDEEIRRLADGLLNAPVLVEVARRNAVTELVTHIAHPVAAEHKREALAHMIRSQDMHQVLIFVRTKQGADRLARALTRDGIECAAIHSDKTQQQRMQVLQDFKDNKVTALVATDIAARGLDIEQLPHVINYEMPNSPEDYVHRSGRTGRAGSTGHAVSLVAPEERQQLAEVEKLIKLKIDQQPVPGFEPGAPRRSSSRREEGRSPRREEPRSPQREEPRSRRREEAPIAATAEAPDIVYPRNPPSNEPPMQPALGGASQPGGRAAPGHHPRHRASKPVAALLGGGTRGRSES